MQVPERASHYRHRHGGGGGAAGVRTGRERLLAKSDGQIGVTLGADTILAALARFGSIPRIGLVTRYMPVGDEQARRFFEDCDFKVVRVKGLRCGGPVLIAHTSETTLRDAIVEVDGPDVDAVVIVGTNLPIARVAGMAEFWLGKPIVALNAAAYWHALRQRGVENRCKVSGDSWSSSEPAGGVGAGCSNVKEHCIEAVPLLGGLALLPGRWSTTRVERRGTCAAITAIPRTACATSSGSRALSTRPTKVGES